MELQNFFIQEQTRMAVYKHLADCYYLPKTNFAENLARLNKAIQKSCEPAAEYVYNMLTAIEEVSDLKGLQIEYTRLFVGPYKLLAPPYGSVYLDGEKMVMGDSTLDALSRYRQAGLDIADDFKDIPDHIAVELEFLHFLVFMEIKRISIDDVQGTVACLQNQRLFLEDNLGAWISEFARNISENTQTEFYKNLAKATESFVKADHNAICTALSAFVQQLKFKKLVEINSLRV